MIKKLVGIEVDRKSTSEDLIAILYQHLKGGNRVEDATKLAVQVIEEPRLRYDVVVGKWYPQFGFKANFGPEPKAKYKTGDMFVAFKGKQVLIVTSTDPDEIAFEGDVYEMMEMSKIRNEFLTDRLSWNETDADDRKNYVQVGNLFEIFDIKALLAESKAKSAEQTYADALDKRNDKERRKFVKALVG